MSQSIDRRIGVDVGGTFTDTVYLDEESNELKIAKSSSTPENYSNGILNSIRKITESLDDVQFFSHGTTVGVNALLENDLAEIGLLTTQGFRDVLEIGRSNRTNMYDPRYEKPEPLVPRRDRLEIPERIDTDGNVVRELDENVVRERLDQLEDKGVDGVAVVLLNGYANPKHEQRIGEIIEAEYPDLHFTLSSDISREYREYERTSTAAINLGIMPVMSAYLNTLEEAFADLGYDEELYIMQSNGGIMTTESAKQTPVNTIKSSLSGGVAGLLTLSDALEIDNIIGADMGGTSFDIELIIDGEARTRPSYKIETPTSGDDGYPIKAPTLDVHSIGSGGGSIAWIDEGSGLHVGSESAGADPGPICYGRGGTEPTVTDAHVVLGRLNPEHLLGGDLELHAKSADKAFEGLGDELGLDTIEAAAGVLEIANTTMARSIRTNILRKGGDPREFTYVAFGGAGPAHAVEIASQIDIPEVIITNSPGNFSAWGILTTDVKHDYVQTFITPVAGTTPKKLEAVFTELEEEGAEQLTEEGIEMENQQFVRFVGMRYVGQEHTLNIPIPNDGLDEAEMSTMTTRFDEAHERQYRHSAPEEPKEIVSVQVTAKGSVESPDLPTVEKGDDIAPDSAFVDVREVYFQDKGFVNTDIIDRSELRENNKIKGPAIFEEGTSTTVLPPEFEASVNQYGHLVVDTGGEIDE